jgi:NAD(P)-dependent dehydrogenase (short-subunit alcohol dehydrogenase family)
MGLSEAAIEEMHQNMAQGIALKRMGRVDEIARAALFLVSDDASLVVGAELFADGGRAEL